MSKATKIIFPTDQKKSVGNIDLSNRLSRSMDSVESIVKHLQEYAGQVKTEPESLRRVSSSINLDKQTTKKHRRSASLSQIQIDVKAETALRSKDSPSDVLLPSDEFIRNIGDSWKVYRNQAGRIFYHDITSHRSSWKPPRNLKPKPRLNIVTAPPVVSMVRNSIREIDDSGLLVPPGYVEYFTKRTGNIYYEDLSSGQKWFTALDSESRLYFYTEEAESGEFRSEWCLPPLSSPLANQGVGVDSSGPGQDNPLDNRRFVKEGVLSWKLSHSKKWSVSCVVLTRDHLVLYSTADSIRSNSPQLRIPLGETEVDWYCGRTKKQGHRIQIESRQTSLVLKLDDEIDAHAWFQSLQKGVQTHKAWLLNNPEPTSPLSEPVSPVFISSPTNVVRTSPDLLIKQLAQAAESQPQLAETKQQNFKLGRKGISKSFRRMANAMRGNGIDEADSGNMGIPFRQFISVRERPQSKRVQGQGAAGRRSVYLAKMLQKRATVEELRTRGIIKDNAVFGCALEHQTMWSTNTSQVPEFLWKCIEKIESKPSYLATEGIYRVPGDASKIQKVRIDIDQGKWESFEKCDQNGEIHVLAGSLKLFLRELPHPLLPHQLHKDLRMAAEGSGKMKDDIPASMRCELEKLEVVNRETLEVVVNHLSRVAKADNKMDIDNIALLFGQVLLWPDNEVPMDFGMLAEAAKNVKVAEALIRYNKEIFPRNNRLMVPR